MKINSIKTNEQKQDEKQSIRQISQIEKELKEITNKAMQVLLGVKNNIADLQGAKCKTESCCVLHLLFLKSFCRQRFQKSDCNSQTKHYQHFLGCSLQQR